MSILARQSRPKVVKASAVRSPGQTARIVPAVCLLVIWTGTLAFYGLDRGFLYRTEALRALVGRNMLHSGDYLMPTLYGEPLLTKGPVMYAAIALASRPFGEVTTWSARIPAACAMVLTALVMFWHLRRYADDPTRWPDGSQRDVGKVGLSSRGALLIAGMIACNPMWLDKATSAEIDMLVVFWVALALASFFRAVDTHPFRLASVGVQVMWWIVALTAVALGTLTKWHAVVFFYATAILYLWWTKRLHLLFSLGHLAGVVVAGFLVGGWMWMVIERVGWSVLWATLWEQALPRISPAHQHGERLWLETPLHPLKMLVCGLPWSGFFWLTLWPRYYRPLTPRLRALLRTLHCWTWPNLVLFTLLPDHDSRHSMPLLTGLVTLGALACYLSLSPQMDGLVRRFGQWGLTVVQFGLGTLVVMGLAQAWWRLPGEQFPLAAILAVVAALILAAAWWAGHRENWYGVVVSILVVWLVGKMAFAELVVPVRSIRDPVGKAALLKQHIPPGETLYIFQAKDEGIMFYYGGPVLRVRNWDHLPDREHVYCLVTPKDMPRLQQSTRWRVIWQRPFLDEQGDPMELVLVQRSAETRTVSAKSDATNSLDEVGPDD